MKISLVSLGCLKNQADSEGLLNLLGSKGYSYTEYPDSADVLLVNTCGFIEDAKRESIDTILTLARQKKKGQRLIVLGCLSKRYREDLAKEMPEVDAFFGVDQADDIAEFLSEGKGSDAKKTSALILSSGTFAPLKVAEGCSRRCGFCVIPDIRGPYRSRPYETVLKEAEDYLSQGIKELLVVAQDLNSYGRDLNDGSYRLPELLKALANLSESEYRVRPLYLYPTDVDSKLLETISSDNKICSYFDIPLQHSEDNILRSMGRAGSRESYLELLRRIRLEVPDAAIRTTMIVGFPGESDKDFRGLLDFVEEAAFDHLGAFAYSDEEGTRAFEMADKVDEDVTQRRLEDLLGIQAEISRERNEMLLGGEYRALVDEVSDEGVIARLERQAPDIDGLTYLKDCEDVEPGSFVDIEITDASDYDLEGHCI